MTYGSMNFKPGQHFWVLRFEARRRDDLEWNTNCSPVFFSEETESDARMCALQMLYNWILDGNWCIRNIEFLGIPT